MPAPTAWRLDIATRSAGLGDTLSERVAEIGRRLDEQALELTRRLDEGAGRFDAGVIGRLEAIGSTLEERSPPHRGILRGAGLRGDPPHREPHPRRGRGSGSRHPRTRGDDRGAHRRRQHGAGRPGRRHPRGLLHAGRRARPLIDARTAAMATEHDEKGRAVFGALGGRITEHARLFDIGATRWARCWRAARRVHPRPLRAMVEVAERQLSEGEGRLGTTLDRRTSDISSLLDEGVRTVHHFSTTARARSARCSTPHASSLGSHFSDRIAPLHENLDQRGRALVDTIAASLGSATEAVEARTRALASLFDERIDHLDEVVERRGSGLTDAVEARTRALTETFDQRLGALDEIVDRRGATLVERVEDRTQALTSSFDRQIGALDTLVEQRIGGIEAVVERRSGEMAEAVDARTRALGHLFDHRIGLLGQLVDGRGAQLTETLDGRNQSLATLFEERLGALEGIVDGRGQPSRRGPRCAAQGCAPCSMRFWRPSTVSWTAAPIR